MQPFNRKISNKQRINQYLFEEVSFKDRSCRLETKIFMYETFKQFLNTLEDLTTKEYECAVQRFCDKVLL